MTAPSRRSTGRRKRALRALADRLEGELGPDESRIVFTFDDGWTVRRVTRWQDQVREGWLLHHCLRKATATSHDPNCWSLRDADNLPHLTFTAWRKPDETSPRAVLRMVFENLDETSRATGINNIRDVAILAAKHRLTDAHRKRLMTFAGKVDPAVLPGLGSRSREALRQVIQAEIPVNLKRPEDASLRAIYEGWRAAEQGELEVEVEPVSGKGLAGLVASFLNEELGGGLFGANAVLDADVSLVAWSSGEIAGAALAKIKPAVDVCNWFGRYPEIAEALPSVGTYGDLEALAVRAEFRGHGIGTRLLAERIEALDAMYVDHLVACAWSSAEFGCHAGSLLEAAGFEPVGIARHFYAGWVVCPLCGPSCTCDCVVYLRTLDD